MKISMACDVFSSASRKVLQFAGTRVMPGFGLVRIDVKDDGFMRMTAQNGRVGVCLRRPVASVEEAGSIFIPSHQLDSASTVIPRTGIMTMTSSGAGVKIGAGNIRLDLSLGCSEDFSRFPVAPSFSQAMTVREPQVTRIVEGLLWSVSNEQVYPALAGVHLTHEFSEVTDIYKAARLSPGILEPGTEIMVPSGAWRCLAAMLGGGGETMLMVSDARRLWVKCADDWVMYTSLIDPDFPLFSDVFFDTDGGGGVHTTLDNQTVRVHWIKVNRHDLVQAMKHLASGSLGCGCLDTCAKFWIDEDDRFHVSTHYPEEGARGILVDEIVGHEDGDTTDPGAWSAFAKIVFKHDNIRLALMALKSDDVKMMWATGFPLQFHDQDMKTLVMPRRL